MLGGWGRGADKEKFPADAYLSDQYLPLCASAERLGLANSRPFFPQPSVEEGTFMPAIHTAVLLPDATLLSSVRDAGPAMGGGGGAQMSVPPSLRHSEPELASHCPGPTTTPGHLRKRTRGRPLRQHPRRPRKSLAKRLLKAAPTALNPSPGALADW